MHSATRLFSGHRSLWLIFYVGILAAWGALFAMQAESLPAALPAAALLRALCAIPAGEAGFAAAFGMWSLMSLAMMAPTAFPALRTYSDLTRTDGAGSRPLAALIGGYLSVWLGFSMLAALLQVLLTDLGLVTPLGRSASPALTGALLVVAGAYQFSRLKNACLNACRSPLAFFFSHWRSGSLGGLQLGLRLGAVCLGCCWALMLLAFVAGTMNLAFMGLAMVLMTLEKLPDIGGHVSAPLGIFLIVTGAVVLVLPLATIIY